MRSYPKINNLTGWSVFAIAAFVYIRTVEPTASFWDCGEFIASSYKLLVQHPPGAPFFLLIGRMFSFLASDVTQIAFWINVLSALCSAFTILFLFWSITMLGWKLLTINGSPDRSQTIALMGAGVVGSLAYAFTDSFWFSAVEAEVYAMLKWERIPDERAANRWLILIAYAVGLSIGTHLLNLVTLPALALIYYYKKYKPTFWGGVLAATVGLVTIGLLMLGVRTSLPALAGQFDIFFVNTLGLPFNTGIIFFILLLVGGLVYGIRYSVRKNKATLNTALLAAAFVLIGYSSYSLILIRANFDPTINLNNPDDVASFMAYLNMEQYGTRPLLHGQHFTAPVIDQVKGAPRYVKGDTKYEVYEHRLETIYDPKHTTILPRLHSRQPGHVQLYRQKLGLREGEKPTMAHNLHFLFNHQLGHMYGRYFMWNFVGRDSDREGAGWQTTLTAKSSLPSEIAGNRGHNRYYMLPLILGLVGLFYQYYRKQRDFLFVAMLFVLTGIALVIYLNSPPVEPRERDYIYVGSFYAFAIWIGLGVLGIWEIIRRLVKNEVLAPALAGVLCLSVPTILIAQNWDDHNRSGRYFSVDSAKNILNSCAPNAILFTNGDNDTYPLWYAQEVEGVRRDVRVAVMQFMASDWYIDQLKRKQYESDALPISLEKPNYVANTNMQIIYYENPNVKNGIPLPQYLQLIREENPALKVMMQDGESYNILPTNKLFLPINREQVLTKGIVPRKQESLVPDTMEIELNKTHLIKDDLVFLDILATNNWERPIYFSSLFTAAKYNLDKYTRVEGVAYRLLPVKVEDAEQGFVDTDIMYENLMQKYSWRGLNDPAVYHDSDHRNYVSNWGRLPFIRLAMELLNENQTDKAREVLLRSLELIPDASIPYERICSLYISPLLRVGEEAKAMEIAETMARRADENLAFYVNQRVPNQSEIQNNLVILNQLARSLQQENHPEATRFAALFDKHYSRF
jgi:hypothetical protein